MKGCKNVEEAPPPLSVGQGWGHTEGFTEEKLSVVRVEGRAHVLPGKEGTAGKGVEGWVGLGLYRRCRGGNS